MGGCRVWAYTWFLAASAGDCGTPGLGGGVCVGFGPIPGAMLLQGFVVLQVGARKQATREGRV